MNFVIQSFKKKIKIYFYYLIASKLSAISKYYDNIIQLLPVENDNGQFLQQINNSNKRLINNNDEIEKLEIHPESRTVILFNGSFNYHFDIQALLKRLKPKLSRHSRVVAILYNPYIKWFYQVGHNLGIIKGPPPTTFIIKSHLKNLAKISGYEFVRMRPVVYCPFRLLGFGSLLNWLLPAIPLSDRFSLATVVILRPIIKTTEKKSLSVIIPTRNEMGNIENAIKRMPNFNGAALEVLFIEGHSTDETWNEILRVKEKYKDQYNIRAYRQPGKGKCDAARFGFSKAMNHLVTILDADLTMPPELLPRFYNSWHEGLGDFINGNRLVYPMEGDAMRFLNRLGNIFFAKALASVLNSSIGDSLCGTKLMARKDYERYAQWRIDFGDFDPFGDYELIFPAVALGCGIVDIPIRYRARTYGSTNIHRFRHGLILLKMVLIGLFKIKMGKLK